MPRKGYKKSLGKYTLAVLGLDAMSWPYFNKLLDHNVMPYTKRILGKSYKATLEAYPPVTPPSWTSIMTGVNPGKHGIFGFFKYDRKEWKQELFTALDLKYPRIHEMLSFLGSKSIVFNPIPDYPIIPVKNAEIVSNLFFAPKPVSWPEESLRKYFGNETPLQHIRVEKNVLQNYSRVIELYEGAAECALKEGPDLLWITLNVPDVFFHAFPKILQRDFLVKEEKEIFSRLDKVIKKLDVSFDSLILVSDHGFSSYDKLVSINDILIENGLASSTAERRTKVLADLYKERQNKGVERMSIPVGIYRTIKILRISGIARLVLKTYSLIKRRKILVSTSRYIDVENSYAFLPDHYLFGIFVKNEKYKEEVLRILEKYNEVLEFYRAEDFYSGPYVKDGPDILVFPRFENGFWILGSNIIGSPTANGIRYAHHPNGIFAVRSNLMTPNISPDEKIPNYSVASIALALMHKPLPKLRDVHRLIEDRLLEKIEETNYEVRWRIMKKSRKRVRMSNV